MPYWTKAEEKLLVETLPKAVSIEELAKSLKRSPEAVAMKLKRMGLQVPPRADSSLVPTESNKVTVKTTTTTTRRLEPVKFEELPSPNEAMGLLWAALQRLQAPDVGREEAKKLRLVLQGVKSYIHLDADYVLRIRVLEHQMLIQNRAIAEQLRSMINSAASPEEKSRLEQSLGEVEESIKEAVALGVGKAPTRNRRVIRKNVNRSRVVQVREVP